MLSAIYENRIPVFLDLCPSDADFSQYSGEITLRKTKKKKSLPVAVIPSLLNIKPRQ